MLERQELHVIYESYEGTVVSLQSEFAPDPFFVAYQKYSSDSLHLGVPSNSLTILGTDVGMGIYWMQTFCRILLPEAQKQDRHVIWALHFGFM